MLKRGQSGEGDRLRLKQTRRGGLRARPFARFCVPQRLRRPLRSRSFRCLVVGKGVSYLGDWLMVAALVGWVYASTSSLGQVALLMSIRLVPPIVGGGLAASIVDRLPRARVLLWSEVACAATVAGALIGVETGSRALVFCFVGLCGLLGMTSTVAGNALVPMVVEPTELPAANSIHAVAQESAMAVGALAGGIALAWGGVATALAANGVSYLVAVALYANISVADLSPEGRSVRKTGGFVEGIRYVVARRALLVVVGSFALVTVATGLVNATLPRLTTGLGLGPSGYAYALAALAAGMMLGETTIGAVTERVDPRWLSPALATMGVLFVALAWTGSGVAVLLLMASFGVANGVAEVVMTTAIHQEAEPAYHGRVFGVGSTIWRTTMLGAVASAPLVATVATPSEAVTVAAACLLIGGGVVIAGLRSRAPEPAPAPA